MIYDGEWKAGKYDGEGKIYQDEKLLYEGTFAEGMKEGEGILYDRKRKVWSTKEAF